MPGHAGAAQRSHLGHNAVVALRVDPIMDPTETHRPAQPSPERAAAEPPFGTAIVVYRRRGGDIEFLMLHRAIEGNWAWGPPTGARRPDENLNLTAARELVETTGLALPLTRTQLGSWDWLVCMAEAPPDATVLISEEHDRYAWLPASAALQLVSPDEVRTQLAGVARLLGAA